MNESLIAEAAKKMARAKRAIAWYEEHGPAYTAPPREGDIGLGGPDFRLDFDFHLAGSTAGAGEAKYYMIGHIKKEILKALSGAALQAAKDELAEAERVIREEAANGEQVSG